MPRKNIHNSKYSKTTMSPTAYLLFKKLILKLWVLLQRELRLIEEYTPILEYQSTLSIGIIDTRKGTC